MRSPLYVSAGTFFQPDSLHLRRLRPSGNPGPSLSYYQPLDVFSNKIHERFFCLLGSQIGIELRIMTYAEITSISHVLRLEFRIKYPRHFFWLCSNKKITLLNQERSNTNNRYEIKIEWHTSCVKSRNTHKGAKRKKIKNCTIKKKKGKKTEGREGKTRTEKKSKTKSTWRRRRRRGNRRMHQRPIDHGVIVWKNMVSSRRD